MKIYNRKSITDNLSKYCTFAKENDFIEVTEWANGEGIDITIHSNGRDKSFSLTYGELDAINYLKMSLDFQK